LVLSECRETLPQNLEVKIAMIVVEINNTSVAAALEDIAKALTDMTPLMREIGDALVASTTKRFGEGTAPDGTKWQPKSATTLARSIDPRPLFGGSGSLSRQIFYEAASDSVLIGSDRPYAAMMQFGGTKEAFPHLWGDIPARPFLGLSQDDESEIIEIISAHLTDMLTAG
jgi:phage virion morphogenesis protein